MKCPQCGSAELRVEVSFAGQVACKFADGGDFKLLDNVALDSSWNDASPCECMSCQWVGTLQNAQVGKIGALTQSEKPGNLETYREPVSTEELQEMERLLDLQRCPPLWREKIEILIAEVKRQNAFLETITRLTDQAASGPNSSSTDTVVG